VAGEPKIIEKLAKDIQNSFPGIEGFSRTNIFRMRAFYIAYQTNPPAGGQFQNDPPEILASIPWRHNSVLVEKLKKNEERMWYAQKTIEHGWSRSVLEIMIGNSLHSRQGRAITNFKAVMPSPQSDLAQQATKDPYLFRFHCIKRRCPRERHRKSTNRAYSKVPSGAWPRLCICRKTIPN